MSKVSNAQTDVVKTAKEGKDDFKQEPKIPQIVTIDNAMFIARFQELIYEEEWKAAIDHVKQDPDASLCGLDSQFEHLPSSLVEEHDKGDMGAYPSAVYFWVICDDIKTQRELWIILKVAGAVTVRNVFDRHDHMYASAFNIAIYYAALPALKTFQTDDVIGPAIVWDALDVLGNTLLTDLLVTNYLADAVRDDKISACVEFMLPFMSDKTINHINDNGYSALSLAVSRVLPRAVSMLLSRLPMLDLHPENRKTRDQPAKPVRLPDLPNNATPKQRNDFKTTEQLLIGANVHMLEYRTKTKNYVTQLFAYFASQQQTHLLDVLISLIFEYV